MRVTSLLLSLLLLSAPGGGRVAMTERLKPVTAAATPVWIDTDPSIAPGGHEVDDGFALVQAFHSPELRVRGVSVTFGNAPLATTWPIGQELVRRFGPAGLGVYKGAASAEELGHETDASRALAAALRRERLSILAIGPVTNVATVLQLHPELRSQVVTLVAVAGRRPGQRFAIRLEAPLAFRDLNFELDAGGFQVLLDSGVPLVLAPWEISSKVWLRRADVERLKAGGPGAQFLVPPAMDWLETWRTKFDVDGFNPFDTLAVGYLTSPRLLVCERGKVRIESRPDDVDAEAASRSKPYLLFAKDLASSHAATYCSEALPAFHDDLMTRLLRTAQ